MTIDHWPLMPPFRRRPGLPDPTFSWRSFLIDRRCPINSKGMRRPSRRCTGQPQPRRRHGHHGPTSWRYRRPPAAFTDYSIIERRPRSIVYSIHCLRANKSSRRACVLVGRPLPAEKVEDTHAIDTLTYTYHHQNYYTYYHGRHLPHTVIVITEDRCQLRISHIWPVTSSTFIELYYYKWAQRTAELSPSAQPRSSPQPARCHATTCRPRPAIRLSTDSHPVVIRIKITRHPDITLNRTSAKDRFN